MREPLINTIANAQVVFDDETLQPLYRGYIGELTDYLDGNAMRDMWDNMTHMIGSLFGGGDDEVDVLRSQMAEVASTVGKTVNSSIINSIKTNPELFKFDSTDMKPMRDAYVTFINDSLQQRLSNIMDSDSVSSWFGNIFGGSEDKEAAQLYARIDKLAKSNISTIISQLENSAPEKRPRDAI